MNNWLNSSIGVERSVRRVMAAVIIVCASGLAARQPPPLRLTEPVNDFAKVIDETTTRELTRLITTLEKTTGDAVVVATVKTFKPYGDIREYAVKLFENEGRGIGRRDKDSGVLIVLAVEDRRVWIEVGYGLEEFIPDGFAGETSRMMAELFRRQDYGGGIRFGVTRLINRLAERRGVRLGDQPQRDSVRSRPRAVGAGILILVFSFLLILFIIGGLIRRVVRGPRRRRRRLWGNSSSWSGWNSGAGSFGGGSSSGGGFGGGSSSGGGFGGGFGGFGGGRSGGGGGGAGW